MGSRSGPQAERRGPPQPRWCSHRLLRRNAAATPRVGCATAPLPAAGTGNSITPAHEQPVLSAVALVWITSLSPKSFDVQTAGEAAASGEGAVKSANFGPRQVQG